MSTPRGIESTLLEERMVAYLDPGAEWVLRILNEPPGVSTTSSCLGRITLIEGTWPWERKGDTRIVFKSHTWVSPYRLALEIVKPYENLWLKVTGPIIHLRISTPSCAEWLLERARSHGFKHSGAISLSGNDGCCVLEVSAPTGFSAALRLGWRYVVNPEGVKKLARAAALAIAEGRRRLALLALRIAREWRESPCQ